MRPFHRRCVAAYALMLTLAGWSSTGSAAADTDKLSSGLYEMRHEGDGRATPRADVAGAEPVMLGKRLTPDIREAKLVSMSNDNSRYRLTAIAGPIPQGADVGHHALVVAGLCLPIGSTPERRADGTVEVGTVVAGAAAADKIAAELAITPQRRAHPGHQMLTSFAPEKPSFAPDEPVMLVMTITNVGTVPIRFGDGGSQRGARNKQFGFTACTYDKAIPDTRDPTHFGGLIGTVELEPGKSGSA